MSRDYFLFLHSNGTINDICGLLEGVKGVRFLEGDLQITGLLDVECTELEVNHRKTMLRQFGSYGLNVNWLIRGTYDDRYDSNGVIERLFRCAAAIINTQPSTSLSLMREAEHFYLFNTAKILIIPPEYIKAWPVITSLFEKNITITRIQI